MGEYHPARGVVLPPHPRFRCSRHRLKRGQREFSSRDAARDVRRDDPATHRTRVGAVVRPARRLARRHVVAQGHRPAGGERVGDRTVGVGGPSRRPQLRTRPRSAGGRPAHRRIRRHRDEDSAVPVERLFDAVVDRSRPRSWLPDDQFRERTSSRPKSVRFDWGDGATRVNVTLWAKKRFEEHGDDRALSPRRCHRRRHDEGVLAHCSACARIAARGGRPSRWLTSTCSSSR